MIGIAAAVIVGYAAGSTQGEGGSSAATTETVVADAPDRKSGPADMMSDGMYEVSVDVKPGRYKTDGPDGDGPFDNCYWARHKNDTGDFGALIANSNLQGPGSVSIKKGEFVELSGGCTWRKN